MRQLELPLLSAALRLGRVPLALLLSRWLPQSFINLLPWPALTTALVLPFLLGADFQVTSKKKKPPMPASEQIPSNF